MWLDAPEFSSHLSLGTSADLDAGNAPSPSLLSGPDSTSLILLHLQLLLLDVETCVLDKNIGCVRPLHSSSILEASALMLPLVLNLAELRTWSLEF